MYKFVLITSSIIICISAFTTTSANGEKGKFFKNPGKILPLKVFLLANIFKNAINIILNFSALQLWHAQFEVWNQS